MDPTEWFSLGIALTNQRRFDDAIAAFHNAVDHDPALIDAHTNIALLRFLQGAYDLALVDLGAALTRDPDNCRALVMAARVQQRRGRLVEAQGLCDRVLALDPSHLPIRLVLGRVLFELGQLADAHDVLAELVAADPRNAEALHEWGVVQKALGRIDDARATLRQAVQIDPRAHATYAALADLVDFAQEPDLVAQIVAECRALATDPHRLTGPNDPLIPLHYAAGKALDDRGAHRVAIEHYIAGAALKRAHLAYDEGAQIALCRAIKATFTPEFMASHALVGNPSAAPVFIVGLARSGSTLVEQILACHPDVHGGDEARHLPAAIDASGLRGWPGMMGVLRQDHVDVMACAWLAAASAPAGAARRITDKLLSNCFFLGLIAVLFPNAKVIQIVRDPVDTCVSAFTTLFARDMAHSYDFGELARYHQRHVDLMDHWHSVLPPGMLTTVHYEDVVRDLEGEARRLVAFVGLEWDPACLAFHASARAVRTASVAQVRRPLYASSIARWRRYGPALDPLIAALTPHPIHFVIPADAGIQTERQVARLVLGAQPGFPRPRE
ncbi:tetratricopeptide repeat-containing sulfotransferase family protein [Novosphingobium sp.]|uniref:tetratricopeptide repeat-containing sulfotransferase family protein n=1 Tax=Novosphingobium sp. TaxID=1874826 RepID=UPI003D11AB3D